MKLDYNLSLEQTQKLIITPELKLAITLLQYSTLEIKDHIQEELLNNPVLEVIESREDEKIEGEGQETDGKEDKGNEEFTWDEYFRDAGIDTGVEQSGNTRPKAAVDGQSPVENCARIAENTMLEDLLGQLRLLPLTAQQYSTAAYLVGNLDNNGYLQGELEELAPALGAQVSELKEALKIVQKLEPPGIGCRSLQECLLLQLNKMEKPWELTVQIVKNYLPAAADERYSYIASCLGCDEEAVREAVEFIRTLNPKPGSVFGEGEETRYIVPDVIAQKVDDNYVVMSNEVNIPQLTISPYYHKMLKSGLADEELSSFIKNKIEKAYWLIRSIEQRRITLHKVSQQIVDIQKPFLQNGIKKLKPLTLKEVALKVGVHESTVSRAAANKYIQTPRGLFPLKFFFSSGLSGTQGSDHSSPSIKSHISELVDAEDQQKPLSDKRLAELLKERGIKISRRTIAKYREEMAIPPSFKRRRS
ncbi:MAG: RNA polymerase factor sigma-54 [Bacillota bacterium]